MDALWRFVFNILMGTGGAFFIFLIFAYLEHVKVFSLRLTLAIGLICGFWAIFFGFKSTLLILSLYILMGLLAYAEDRREIRALGEE
jgi:hypothetical protein